MDELDAQRSQVLVEEAASNQHRMANDENNLKTYIAPWRGQLLLACRKCQKKLRDDDALRSLAKLKKSVKRYNKAHPGADLFVLNVPCMDLCPKDGVTVCFPARQPVCLSILRGEEDLARIANAS